MAKPPVDVTDPVAPAIVASAGPAVGDRVGDRYRLEGRIGRGGGGTVWRAFDEKLEEIVALKIVAETGNPERWRREVALARRISHPNVCRVFDLGEDEPLRWVTMELVSGESLRHAIASGSIEPARADAIIAQIVSGVAAIHAAGIIHRDLKPDNIILADDGRTVIVDFGIAREQVVQLPVTQEGMVIGTPGYMAPEQALGQPVDQRTDVYALGLVLHEVVTGKLPSPFGVTKPERPSRMGAASPRPLEGRWRAIIERSLEVDPDERFANALEVARALGGERASKRRWPLLGAAALGVVAGTLTLVLLASSGSSESGPRAVDAAPPPDPISERRLTFSKPETQPVSAAISSDGKRVAFSVGGEVFSRSLESTTASPVVMPTTERGKPLSKLAIVIGYVADGSLGVLLHRRDSTQVWLLGKAEPQPIFESERRFLAAISPNGERLAVATPGHGLEIVPVAGGTSRRVVTSEQGESITAMAWSPSGDEVAFVRYPTSESPESIEVVPADGGAPRTVLQAPLGIEAVTVLLWPRELVVATVEASGDALLTAVAAESGERRVLSRWPGEAVTAGAHAAGRVAVIRGSRRPRIYVGTLTDKYGYVSSPDMAHPESTSARELAGWMDDGRLVYSSSSGRSFDIVAATVSGEGEVIVGGSDDLFADSLTESALLYQKPGAAGVELWLAELGGDSRKLTSAGGGPRRPRIRCAGDRKAPCVIEVSEPRTARFHLLDPVSGETGREIHSMPVLGMTPRTFALSSDATTLAVVDGSSSLAFIDVGSGRLETVTVEGARMHSVSWANDDKSVVVGASGYRGKLHNLVRVGRDGKTRSLEGDNHQRFVRARESRDGEDIAIETIDHSVELWVLDGF